jgi:hypothetical protein
MTRERRPDLFEKARPMPEGKKTANLDLNLALLHYPVYDKNGQVVTTAVTNMDIHDIARSAKTYGVKTFYVVTHVKPLQRLALKIIDHWERGYGSQYNETRKEALSLVRVKDTLDDVILELERTRGIRPLLVATSARDGRNRISFREFQDMLKRESRPFLILLGTGWGLTAPIIAQSDALLEPIQGETEYNHLSVRSAAAILLDRLLGKKS